MVTCNEPEEVQVHQDETTYLEISNGTSQFSLPSQYTHLSGLTAPKRPSRIRNPLHLFRRSREQKGITSGMLLEGASLLLLPYFGRTDGCVIERRNGRFRRTLEKLCTIFFCTASRTNKGLNGVSG